MGLDLSNPGTKVFIGNVAWSTTNETLSHYLAQQGTPGAPAPPRHTACPHTPPLSRVRAVFPRLCARRAFALHGPLPIVRRPRGASESASVRRAKPVPWPRQARRVHRQAHPADYYFWFVVFFLFPCQRVQPSLSSSRSRPRGSRKAGPLPSSPRLTPRTRSSRSATFTRSPLQTPPRVPAPRACARVRATQYRASHTTKVCGPPSAATAK